MTDNPHEHKRKSPDCVGHEVYHCQICGKVWCQKCGKLWVPEAFDWDKLNYTQTPEDVEWLNADLGENDVHKP